MEFARWARDQWDRVLAGVAGLAGAIVLIVSWAETSQSVYPAQQMPYIVSGGLGGIFLIGLSATLWLSADLRDEWRKLDRVEDTFSDLNHRLARLEGQSPGAGVAPETAHPAPPNGSVKIAPLEERSRP